jgi:hypothetical protein
MKFLVSSLLFLAASTAARADVTTAIYYNSEITPWQVSYLFGSQGDPAVVRAAIPVGATKAEAEIKKGNLCLQVAAASVEKLKANPEIQALCQELTEKTKKQTGDTVNCQIAADVQDGSGPRGMSASVIYPAVFTMVANDQGKESGDFYQHFTGITRDMTHDPKGQAKYDHTWSGRLGANRCEVYADSVILLLKTALKKKIGKINFQDDSACVKELSPALHHLAGVASYTSSQVPKEWMSPADVQLTKDTEKLVGNYPDVAIGSMPCPKLTAKVKDFDTRLQLLDNRAKARANGVSTASEATPATPEARDAGGDVKSAE